MHALLPFAAVLALTLAACARTDDAARPAAAPAHAALPAAPSSPPTATSVHFDCDGGHQVDMLVDVARVALMDGRVVDVPADGARYRGEALAFTPSGDHGTLSQDEVGAFSCRRTG